jgi:hypothetical protein
MFNHALLGKWLWRYVYKRKAWWRVAVDVKFGRLWRGWCSIEPSGAFGVGLWKSIRRGWGNFTFHTKFEVGDGFKIKF